MSSSFELSQHNNFALISDKISIFKVIIKIETQNLKIQIEPAYAYEYVPDPNSSLTDLREPQSLLAKSAATATLL